MMNFQHNQRSWLKQGKQRLRDCKVLSIYITDPSHIIIIAVNKEAVSQLNSYVDKYTEAERERAELQKENERLVTSLTRISEVCLFHIIACNDVTFHRRTRH